VRLHDEVEPSANEDESVSEEFEDLNGEETQFTEDDVVYYIERVLDKRTYEGKVEYFIKWKGYSDADNLWIAEEKLQQCKPKLEEYENSVKGLPTTNISKRKFGVVLYKTMPLLLDTS